MATYTVQVHVPEGLTALDLDIIKLTAQFVARNGAAFLTGLTQREGNNPQFYFLKPTHSMFGFFTSLADAYSAVLMPDKGLREKLASDATDRYSCGLVICVCCILSGTRILCPCVLACIFCLSQDMFYCRDRRETLCFWAL